jgi:hypothetical protein
VGYSHQGSCSCREARLLIGVMFLEKLCSDLQGLDIGRFGYGFDMYNTFPLSKRRIAMPIPLFDRMCQWIPF